MSSASSSSSTKTITWTHPRTKERLTLKCAPPHEDGRPRIVCDLCAFPCIVTSWTQLSNFVAHRGCTACVKKASLSKAGEGKEGKITAHFVRTPSTSSRASSAAVSEALETVSRDSPPRTDSSAGPRNRMEIDLTSPSPEPKKKVGLATTTTARASGSKGATGLPAYATATISSKAAPATATATVASSKDILTTTNRFTSGATSYQSAASASASARSTPTHNKAISVPTIASLKTITATSGLHKPTSTSTLFTSTTAPPTPTPTTTAPSSDVPQCTSCRRPNTAPQFRLCPACRAYYRERTRIDGERKRANAALLLAEAGGDPGEIRRAREKRNRAVAMVARKDDAGAGGAGEKKKAGRKRKRAEDYSPSLYPMPDIVFDPDECGTAPSAYFILKSALSPPPVKPPRQPRLNIRLTWAVVADGSVSHRVRIEIVVRELRKVGLQFSSSGKVQDPGSSPYARYHALTERFRCKCTSSPSVLTARRQSALSTYFAQKGTGVVPMEEDIEDEDEDVLMLVNADSSARKSSGGGGMSDGSGGAGAVEEGCGGYVYVSSEWDVQSHPAGVRGQRVVVWVVHLGGDDPVQ